MLHLVCLLVWFGPCVVVDEPELKLSATDVHEIIARIVARNPVDREVLFIDLLYGSKTELCADDRALKELESNLHELGDQRFAEAFSADAKYRRWLLDAVQELRFNLASRDQDLQLLAQHFESASLKLGLSLNHVSHYKLLYLIRYLGTTRGRSIVVPTSGKGVLATQLLVLLQSEHSSRRERQP